MNNNTFRRSVLVTGGTRRIGKAISDVLRNAGWRVFTSSHDPDSGADFIQDFTDCSGAVKLYSSVLSADPEGFCAIVNNAALFTGSDADLESVNLIAPRKLMTLLGGREGVKCSIVNILDSKTLGPAQETDSAYVKTKRELLSDTRKFAAMFADSMRVNAVAPGPVLAPVGVHESAGEMLLKHRPTPQDVASAVLYLLEAESVTGAVIPVDSGQHLLG
ncbi:MAG: SDR family oxidoreductase [Kiritimatiellae bacterium]|nr:SDR family oxidoreductase [Kiritimatiellia bacterium]